MPTTPESRLLRCASATYGLLLRVYPPKFQREYGREMLRVFRNQAQDMIRAGSGLALVRFALRILWDWTKTVLDEMEAKTMRKTLAIGAATLLLLIVDCFTFHDWREPHTVRDYLTLIASVLVFFNLGIELIGREKTRLETDAR